MKENKFLATEVSELEQAHSLTGKEISPEFAALVAGGLLEGDAKWEEKILVARALEGDAKWEEKIIEL